MLSVLNPMGYALSHLGLMFLLTTAAFAAETNGAERSWLPTRSIQTDEVGDLVAWRTEGVSAEAATVVVPGKKFLILQIVIDGDDVTNRMTWHRSANTEEFTELLGRLESPALEIRRRYSWVGQADRLIHEVRFRPLGDTRRRPSREDRR